ncbi:hypothetical protein [Streptosporangium roseum]|uniref:Uncharacterized protein n=1 Tax=Streptosporangium roseum (strain ATCC 12428 / DSM 43021 / JCM 3005 / KCTC 9067 / NCIMB 10171 / NRRL 2505 / NI 9100) TaxID=479432 RepID=D2B994_STRRD|nr:hypothetical protein [Streptosporangium roseum]ACZ91639.1 hypothetical protein Sros_9008 [Streptosporangium roseum DSM 43021]
MSILSRSAIVRRRRTLVHVVLRDMAETGNTTVPPWWESEIQREFGGLDGFLAELSRQWWTAYAAHLDALIELGSDDPTQAWADVSEQMPHLRAVLDSYTDASALAEAERRHCDVLRWTTRRESRHAA